MARLVVPPPLTYLSHDGFHRSRDGTENEKNNLFMSRLVTSEYFPVKYTKTVGVLFADYRRCTR